MNFFNAGKAAQEAVEEMSKMGVLYARIEALKERLQAAQEDALMENARHKEVLFTLENFLAEKHSLEQKGKWIACKDKLPTEDGRYFVWHKTESGIEFANTANWAGGWNCHRMADGEINRDTEFNDIVAWAEITPYKETEDDDD